MNKQEFAIKLLFWFMPYPMSRALPRILLRLLRGPSAETPGLWAQAAFSALSQLYIDVVSYAESLLLTVAEITPTDQLTKLSAALQASIDNAKLSLSVLASIISNLSAFTTDEILQAFLDAVAAIDDVSLAADSLYSLIPAPPIPAPPPYIPPFPPIYTGPPVPGPGGPSSPPRSPQAVSAPWFYEPFNTIDPAIWTEYIDGTGVNSIVGAKLKQLSNGAGDYAYIETDWDDTIPAAFTLTFELKVLSGTGTMRVVIYTGVHNIYIDFELPNTLMFRNQLWEPYLRYDVGNYIGSTITWKFVYNGTTCDIYKDNVLVAAGCAIYVLAGAKGQRYLQCRDVITVYLDDYTITPS